jgi:hypothetical protein
MDDKMVIVMTAAQLKEIAKAVFEDLVTEFATTETKQPKPLPKYVYGLKGIASLLNVSLSTAHLYKNTFLAPACKIEGNKLEVNVEHAMKLYKEHTKSNGE